MKQFVDVRVASGTVFRVWFTEESIRNSVTNAYLSGKCDGAFEILREVDNKENENDRED